MSDPKPLPCPFCGATNVFTQEGSTFRWWLAGCSECGATAGEVRRQTLGEGTNEEWDAEVKRKAIAAWNERAADARDALRYRWLRDIGDATWRPFGIREGYSAAQADAAIDAAIAKGAA